MEWLDGETFQNNNARLGTLSGILALRQLDFAGCELRARDTELPEGLVSEYVQVGATWGPSTLA